MPCEENGLDRDKGRKYTGPLRWDVEIWYKDMYTASTVTDVKLMHLRLGHCNMKALRKAQQQYKFVKISRNNKNKPERTLCSRPISSTEKIFCSACHIAKFAYKDLATDVKSGKRKHNSEQGGVPIPLNAEFNKKDRAQKFGDLFYVDTLYVILESLHQDKYALVFIDYATRLFVFVHPIKNREAKEVTNVLKQFIKDAKRTVPGCEIESCEIKSIQSDQGKEYKRAWEEVCDENNIRKLEAGTDGHNSQAPVETVIKTLTIKLAIG